MDVEDQHLRRVGPSPGVSERQRKWQPLGQVLVKRGLLSHEQLTAGFEAAAPRRAAVRRVLIERNIISEAALLEGLADQFDKPLMTEEELATIPPEVVRILPEETARANMVIAIEDNAEIDFCVSTLPTIYGERIVRGQRLLQRNDANDNTVVTISQVDAGMITGGGYLVMQNSAGTIAGDPGTRKNFGFYVKYNKSGTNLQGNINTIGRKRATGPARLPDQDEPHDRARGVSVSGKNSLQFNMTDYGSPGSSDTIGITFWNGSCGIWFSTNWVGSPPATVEKLLGGGNLDAH